LFLTELTGARRGEEIEEKKKKPTNYTNFHECCRDARYCVSLRHEKTESGVGKKEEKKIRGIGAVVHEGKPSPEMYPF